MPDQEMPAEMGRHLGARQAVMLGRSAVAAMRASYEQGAADERRKVIAELTGGGRCESVRPGTGAPRRCDLDAGHDGDHWRDEGGHIMQWHDPAAASSSKEEAGGAREFDEGDHLLKLSLDADRVISELVCVGRCVPPDDGPTTEPCWLKTWDDNEDLTGHVEDLHELGVWRISAVFDGDCPTITLHEQRSPAPSVSQQGWNLRDARAAMCSEGGRRYVEKEVLKPFGYVMVPVSQQGTGEREVPAGIGVDAMYIRGLEDFEEEALTWFRDWALKLDPAAVESDAEPRDVVQAALDKLLAACSFQQEVSDVTSEPRADEHDDRSDHGELDEVEAEVLVERGSSAVSGHALDGEVGEDEQAAGDQDRERDDLRAGERVDHQGRGAPTDGASSRSSQQEAGDLREQALDLNMRGAAIDLTLPEDELRQAMEEAREALDRGEVPPDVAAALRASAPSPAPLQETGTLREALDQAMPEALFATAQARYNAQQRGDFVPFADLSPRASEAWLLTTYAEIREAALAALSSSLDQKEQR